MAEVLALEGDDEKRSTLEEETISLRDKGPAAPVAAAAPLPVDCAREKRWEQLQGLLEAGAACDSVDDLGRTALHYAAGYGELAVVRALCKAGADANAGDRTGMTPLHWACLKAQAPVVEALLRDSKADAFLTATAGIFKGRCALDLADHAQSGAVREVLLKQLGASMFELRKVVGRGGYGCVVKAVRKDTGGTVALKAVRKSPSAGPSAPGKGASQLTGALTERAVLSEIEHPFIVQLCAPSRPQPRGGVRCAHAPARRAGTRPSRRSSTCAAPGCLRRHRGAAAGLGAAFAQAGASGSRREALCPRARAWGLARTTGPLSGCGAHRRYLVMDFCAGGDLSLHIRASSQSAAGLAWPAGHSSHRR